MTDENLLYSLDNLEPFRCLVIGVGGCGCTVINEMIAAGYGGVTKYGKVTYLALDSDSGALEACRTEQKIFVPKAVLLDEAEQALWGQLASIPCSHMVFVVSGMGGQTGTKLSPLVAEYARQQEALTIGIATCPLPTEGGEYKAAAEKGLSAFHQHANCLIVVPLENVLPENVPELCSEAAYRSADKAILTGIMSITDTMIRKGLIGFDFADLKTVLENGGMSRVGYGTAIGKECARQAVDKAISSPLLGVDKLKSALGVIAVIVGGNDDGIIGAISEISGILVDSCNDNTLIFSQGFYDGKDGELSVAIITCEEADAVAWYEYMEAFIFDEDEFETPSFIMELP